MDHLSALAIQNKLDKRKDLRDQDMTKLYNLVLDLDPNRAFPIHKTEETQKDRSRKEKTSEITIEEKEKVKNLNGIFEIDRFQAVFERIEDQIHEFTSTLHQFLDEEEDTVPFAKTRSAGPDDVMFPEQMLDSTTKSKFFSFRHINRF